MQPVKAADNYFEKIAEPAQSCLLSLRSYLLAHDAGLEEKWKYGMPFYCYKNRMFCYLWVDKKSGWPYIGIVNGLNVQYPGLVLQQRKKMKVFYIDPAHDLPLKDINNILALALDI